MDKISEEWDSLASTRSRQIRTGLDTSFNNVLLPNIISVIKKYDLTNVLDVGCGTGELTKEVSKIAKHIDAIDISRNSINIASDFCIDVGNINLYISSIESFESNSRYSLIYSNMVLMNLKNFEIAIQNISKILQNDGIFIFTSIHPCFWSIYKGYYQARDFSYLTQKQINQPFDIGKERGKIRTTHFHRPLEFYVNTLLKNGLCIIELKELLGEGFNLPRFIMFICKKI